jgi:hypothetical protein
LSVGQQLVGVADSRVNIAIKQVLNFFAGSRAMLLGAAIAQVPTKSPN